MSRAGSRKLLDGTNSIDVKKLVDPLFQNKLNDNAFVLMQLSDNFIMKLRRIVVNTLAETETRLLHWSKWF